MLSSILATIFFFIHSPLLLSQAVFFDHAVVVSSDSTLNYPYSLGPKLTAESAVVVDLDQGGILFDKNSNKILPIASITKLMTALVFLENNVKEWQEKITVEAGDVIVNSGDNGNLEPAGIGVQPGQTLIIKDIFYASLIRSANDATNILSRLIDLPDGKEFVDLMNEKAALLRMNDTHFVDATGLNSQTRSTAHDLVKLVLAAMKNEQIREALNIRSYDFPIYTAKGQKFYRTIRNTDKLLGNFIDFTGAKTGYLEESGYCFAGLSEYAGRRLVVVILNAASDEDRFQEAKSLVWWAAENEP